MAATPAPVPRLDELKEEHRTALEGGRLTFQHCRNCGNAWLPTREECPRCLEADFDWEDASGEAKLVSWCVYHRSPLPEFQDRVPYTVYLVELAEGPRMIGSPTSESPGEPGLDRRLELVIEREGEIPVPRFRCV